MQFSSVSGLKTIFLEEDLESAQLHAAHVERYGISPVFEVNVSNVVEVYVEDFEAHSCTPTVAGVSANMCVTTFYIQYVSGNKLNDICVREM